MTTYSFNPSDFNLLDFTTRDRQKLMDDLQKAREWESLTPTAANALDQAAAAAGVASTDTPEGAASTDTAGQQAQAGNKPNVGNFAHALLQGLGGGQQPSQVQANVPQPQTIAMQPQQPQGVGNASEQAANAAASMAQNAQAANQQAMASSADLQQNRNAQMSSTEQQASQALQQQVARQQQADALLGKLIGLGLNIATGGFGGAIDTKTWRDLF